VPFGPYVFSVAARDADHALAAGTGAVRLTSDGGETWTLACFPEGVGGYVRAITVRGRRVWAVAGTNDQPVVVRSEDGGEHFVPVPIGVQGFGLSDITFVDEDHGWAVGSRLGGDTRFGPQYGGGGLVLRTGDGGRTWEVADDLPFDLVGGLRRVAFVDRSHGFALGQTRGNNPLLLASADSGSTWQARTVPGGIGEVRDLTFVDDQRGWLLGLSGENKRPDGSIPTVAIVMGTTDGGATWDEQWRMAGMNVWEFDFTDSQTGFVIGELADRAQSALLATSDGGTSWTLSDVPGRALTTIDFSDARHGWVGGMQGACVRVTDDGGRTWASRRVEDPPGPCTG
jgi:photosystem II stability/assembly factor-like uncharacterized protein